MSTANKIAMLLAASLVCAFASAAEPARADVVAAMKKAATFMNEKVALRGGHVWLVSEDLGRRWGEIPARPSQIWLQGGTERVGQVMLDAYEVTQDVYYLDSARKAADALVFGQHPLGGWHYFIDFDPAGTPGWYETDASRFRWGYEEYRHYYGNATFDDQVTPDAAMFLLRFYRLTHEAAYREPVLKALNFVLAAQYPNGAWPQRFPLRYEFAHDGLPDYTSFYTLNDGAMFAIVELLYDAYETLGDPRYFESVRRGMDALLALQGPDDQAAWAEQHGPNMRPIAARTHEPAGYVVRESAMSIHMLEEFYLRTGDARYLAPVPHCLDWFDRINREAAAAKYPTPRYWEPGTNKPVYVVRTQELTAEGYGKYIWTTDPAKARCDGQPCKVDGKPIVDVAPMRARNAALAALATPKARAARLAEMKTRRSRAPRGNENIADVIAALDARGAWVTDGNVVQRANAPTEAEQREIVRGINTGIFASRMETLIAYLRKP
ncbi:MAG TPA: pectate lyase [Steroidobacteraceae bacterium]|nr:pectate lyase [Steroidobacteraceae bacterium]